MLRYSAVCVDYDEPTRLAAFEVRDEPARALGRMLAGLPLNDDLQPLEAGCFGSEGGQIAEAPSDD